MYLPPWCVYLNAKSRVSRFVCPLCHIYIFHYGLCWLQVTPNNFLKDEAIQTCCTLVEAIEETIEASTIGCTKWVINLEKPTWRT
jgi:hypothetical protein